MSTVAPVSVHVAPSEVVKMSEFEKRAVVKLMCKWNKSASEVIEAFQEVHRESEMTKTAIIMKTHENATELILNTPNNECATASYNCRAAGASQCVLKDFTSEVTSGDCD